MSIFKRNRNPTLINRLCKCGQPLKVPYFIIMGGVEICSNCLASYIEGLPIGADVTVTKVEHVI